MEQFTVGEKYSSSMLLEKGKILVDINDTAVHAFVAFKNLSYQEISQFNGKAPFEVRYLVWKNIIFFLFKIGTLSWMSAPFTPHLAPYLSTYDLLEDLGENQGLAIHLYFFNCADGTLENMRLIRLGFTFSKKLMRDILEISIKPFDENDYLIKLAALYSKYSVKELLKFSKERHQI